jgi:hypothetical protein
MSQRGIIYLIQPGLLVGSKIYKLGYSNSPTLSRCINGYIKGSRYISIHECYDPSIVEKILIKKFNLLFKLVGGKENFEGDESHMSMTILQTIIEYKQNNINNTTHNTTNNTTTNTLTNTPTNTPTNTLTNTPTNTSTNTPTNTPTNTSTNTPTNATTNTSTNTLTNTSTNTLTNTPTNTLTNTPTNTLTNTPTNTLTNTPTNISTNISTNPKTNTSTNISTNTSTNTPTNTPTNTSTNATTNISTNIPNDTTNDTTNDITNNKHSVINYYCKICKSYYSSYQSLWIHNKKYHINNCEKCNKKFDNLQNKLIHQKNCNSVSNQNLKFKLGLELDILKYKISKLENNTSNTSNILENNTINTSNKLSCKYCNKLFKYKQGKWRHEQKCKIKQQTETTIKNNIELEEKIKAVLIKMNSETINNN